MAERIHITSEEIDLVRKYFQKKCTDKEQETFINWITGLNYESKLRKILSDHWDEINADEIEKDPGLDIMMGQLHRAINIKLSQEKQNEPIVRKIYRQFSRIAAIIILPLLAFILWYLNGNKQMISNVKKPVYAEIVSPPAARIHFELPDGTTGWLNSESTLKFPYKFSSGEREVRLTGEGYFEVFPDEDKPFIVNTSNARITALGTIFNVMDNSQDENIEATLLSGRIKVQKLKQDGQIITFGELVPNQQIVFSRNTGYTESKTVIAEFFTAWKDGKLVFRNEPMKDVVKKLSRWYNVDFEIKDKELEKIIFRATFVDETLSEVLKVLKLTSGINYIEHPREIQPDGTYSKKQITLFLNY